MADILNVFKTVYDTVGDIAYLKAASAVDQTNKYMKQSTDQLNVSQAQLEAKLKMSEVAFVRQQAISQKADLAYKANQQSIQNLSTEFEVATAKVQQFARERELAEKAGAPLRAGIAQAGEIRAKVQASELSQKIAEQNEKLSQNKLAFDAASAKAKTYAATQDEIKLKMEQANKVMEARDKEAGKMGFFEQVKARIGKTFSSLEQFSKDFDAATKTAHRAANATEKFLNIADRLSIALRGKPIFDYNKNIQQTGTTAEMASKGLGLMETAALTAANPVLGLGVIATSLGTIIGNVLVSALQAAVSGFINLAQASVGVVRNFESQVMGLKSMVAQDLMATDSTLDFEKAMGMAGEKALVLTKWLEALSIKSPFTEQDVKQTFMQAKQFGFTADESARLTKATLDWAAASNKQGYQMGLVTYALGQVRSQGKLLGGELFQLRNAGLDMNSVFASIGKTMGKTAQEVQAMQQQGKLSAQDFLQGVVSYMESLSGAANEQANSFNGLLSSLSDLAPKFLREFFGPMDEATGKIRGLLGAIQPYLAQLVEVLMSPEVIGAVRETGLELGRMAESAFAWGKDLVLNYAEGVVQGIGYLVDALSSIAEMVAYWLMPGSPPRILPNIDEWGKQTAGEWLKGFTQVSAGSMFLSLGDTMERFMKNQAGEDTPHLIDQILGSRKVLLTAVEEFSRSGAISTKTFDELGRSIGGGASSILSYVSAVFAAEKASLKLQEAQKQAALIAQQFDVRLGALSRRLTEIQTARTERDEEKRIKRLQRILADPKASPKRRLKAQEELEELMLTREMRRVQIEKNAALESAQAKIDAAQKEYDTAQIRLKLQEMQLQALEKQNTLLEEQKRLIEQLNKESSHGGEGRGGGGDGRVPPGGFSIGGLPDKEGIGVEKSLFDKLAERLGIDKLQEKWDGFTGSLGKLWEAIMPYVPPIQNFLNTWGEQVGRVATAVGDLWNNSIVPLFNTVTEGTKVGGPWDLFNIFLNANSMLLKLIGDVIVDKIIPGFASFADWVAENWPKWVEIFEGSSKDMGAALEKFSPIFDALKEIAQLSGEAMSKALTDAQKTFTDMIAAIKKSFDDFKLPFSLDWSNWNSALDETAKTAWEGVKKSVSENIEAIAASLRAIAALMRGDWKKALDEAKTAFTSNWESATTAMETAKTIIIRIGGELVGNFRNNIDIIVGKVRQGFDDIKQAATDKWNETYSAILNTWEALKIWFSINFALLYSSIFQINWYQAGVTLMQNIINGVISMLGPLMQAAQDVFDQIWDAIVGNLPPPGGSRPVGGYRVSPPARRFGIGGGAAGGSSFTNQYNLNVSSNQASQGVAYDFAIMEIQAG